MILLKICSFQSLKKCSPFLPPESTFGTVSESSDMNDFNLTTTSGAIEYIIAYVQKTWNCPIVFWTNTNFHNARYEQLISILLEVQKKWGIFVLDLYHKKTMYSLTADEYQLYLFDSIHPTMAGYLKW